MLGRPNAMLPDINPAPAKATHAPRCATATSSPYCISLHAERVYAHALTAGQPVPHLLKRAQLTDPMSRVLYVCAL